MEKGTDEWLDSFLGIRFCMKKLSNARTGTTGGEAGEDYEKTLVRQGRSGWFRMKRCDPSQLRAVVGRRRIGRGLFSGGRDWQAAIVLNEYDGFVCGDLNTGRIFLSYVPPLSRQDGFGSLSAGTGACPDALCQLSNPVWDPALISLEA